MTKLLKAHQYHWSFLFLWILISIWLYHSPTLAFVIIWLLMTARMFALKNRQVIIMMGMLILLFSIRLLQQRIHQHRIQQQTFASTEYILSVNPLQIREGELRVTGRGVLHTQQGDFQVEWYYPRKEGWELPEQTQLWQVKGTLKQPEQARNFHTFDYAEYLENQEIYWQFEVEQLVAKAPINDVMENVRIAILKPLLQHQSISWVGLHNKLLWNLDSQAYRDYRPELMALGIVHFFAISGFHVHYIRYLFDNIIRRSGITLEYGEWIVNILLLIYSWLVGWPVGVVRVVSMIYARRLILRYRMPFSHTDTLAIIGLVLLLIQPRLSMSIGYLLSFLMTYLIHFYQAQAPTKPKWRQNIELTLTCLLFSWPIIMQQSHEWNGWQLVFVVCFTLVFEKILFPLFSLTTLLIWFAPAEWFRGFSQLFEVGWGWLVNFSLQAKPIIVGHLPFFTMCFLFVVAGIWLQWVHSAPKRALIAVCGGYFMMIYIFPYVNPTTRITIIDVGQGDALLYQPAFSREHWLIDTGGKASLTGESWQIDDKFAERTLIPALKALGANRLSGVVITHSDMDHIGNLKQLAQSIAMDTIIINSHTYQSDIWQTISGTLPDEIKTTTLPFQQQVQIPNLQMELYTIPDVSERADMDGSNDTSIVARIPFGQYALLNMGDLSSNAEELLLSNYPHLQATILKTGHHGSKHSTSDKLLTHLKPQLALISAGVDNRYGHPHRDVLERLQGQGVPFLATNEKGAIQLRYDVWGRYTIQTALD